jgi:hypothetical protein
VSVPVHTTTFAMGLSFQAVTVIIPGNGLVAITWTFAYPSKKVKAVGSLNVMNISVAVSTHVLKRLALVSVRLGMSIGLAFTTVIVYSDVWRLVICPGVDGTVVVGNPLHCIIDSSNGSPSSNEILYRVCEEVNEYICTRSVQRCVASNMTFDHVTEFELSWIRIYVFDDGILRVPIVIFESGVCVLR